MRGTALSPLTWAIDSRVIPVEGDPKQRPHYVFCELLGATAVTLDRLKQVRPLRLKRFPAGVDSFKATAI